MESLTTIYTSSALFPLFANRLLSKKRPEYERYLQWGGFDPNNPPEPIAILGLTEGIRQTDSVEVFPCPEPDGDGCYLNRFFLHGIRFSTPEGIARVNQLKSGNVLRIEPEPLNPIDINAIAVFPGGESVRIGYVPRYFAHDARTLLDQCHPEFITLKVELVNHDAPLQQRILCRMTACWPIGFRPCRGPAFDPIPEGIEAACPV
jgi:hypothetical protein